MMIVRSRSSALDCESSKAPVTHYHRSRGIEQGTIERSLPGELTSEPERAVCIFIDSYQVTVCSRESVESRMEVGTHLVRPRYSYVTGENCVESAAEALSSPPFGDSYSGGLTERVHTGVGPTRAEDGDVGPAKALHRVFEHSLNRPFIRLPLPSREVRSVVLKNELQRSRFHCPNYLGG